MSTYALRCIYYIAREYTVGINIHVYVDINDRCNPYTLYTSV